MCAKKISRLKCSTEEWVDVHRDSPRAGHADHGDHDVRLRRDGRTTRQSSGDRPANPGRDRRIHGVHPVDVPAGEHVAGTLGEAGGHGDGVSASTLAISRVYLQNIENVQSSWVTQGLKTCQIGLRFGGNDVGSIMIEENVVSAAGAHNRASEEELRRMIRDAGFTPRQRDTLVPHLLPELVAFPSGGLVVAAQLYLEWKAFFVGRAAPHR